MNIDTDQMMRGWQEAGRLVSKRETPYQRAEHILRTLLPRFKDRDQALGNLYYVTPDATPDIRLFSIAAALYIMGSDADKERT